MTKSMRSRLWTNQDWETPYVETNYQNQEGIDRLLYLFEEYEGKVISRHPVMDCVRDLYYLYKTEMTYKEWLEAKG
tara:strand:- start:202 stop:429 length:228 start_codon:yes stop_codon:yes gene_type:complete